MSTLKTEAQTLQSILLTPGSGMNVHEYRILCNELANKPNQIKKYADGVVKTQQIKRK